MDSQFVCRVHLPGAMLAASLLGLFTLAQAAPPTDRISGELSGTVYSRAQSSNCKLLLTPEGNLYQLAGVPTLADGAHVTLSGTVRPSRERNCGAAVVFDVKSGPHASSQAAQQLRPLPYRGRVELTKSAPGCAVLYADFGQRLLITNKAEFPLRDGEHASVTAKPGGSPSPACTQAGFSSETSIELLSYRSSPQARPTAPVPRWRGFAGQ